MELLCFYYYIYCYFLQEAEAVTLYNKALASLEQGQTQQAKNTFVQLLNLPLIKQVHMFIIIHLDLFLCEVVLF